MAFKIVGNRLHIRSDEEMSTVDKKAADAAFKKYQNKFISPYMNEQGFLKYKSNAYVRKNKIDLLEYVEFQKERHGSKTFTVNLGVMPLYIPCDHIIFYFSNRLGELICRRDIWWDFADEAVCAASMENVKEAIEQFAMPWFHKMSNEHFVRLLLLKKKLSSKLSVYSKEWLNTIDSRNSRAAVIQENVDKLGLPKGLI